MIIYKIKNKINGKAYIGQTRQDPKIRWMQHCQIYRIRSCTLIRQAIEKHGKESFDFIILESCSSKEELNVREKHWISVFKSISPNGYNLTSGGDRTDLSEESKQKISRTLSGRPTGKKGIPSRITPWNKGQPWSLEHRKKLSLAHQGQIPWSTGKKMSLEARSNMSKARIGKDQPSLWKPILCVTTGIVYPSLKAASLTLNLQKSKICLVLKGHRAHTGSLVFRYLTP